MKRNKIFGFLTAALAFGFAACNNDSDSTTGTTDSSGSTNSASGSGTSSNTYAAKADSVRVNVTAGNYLNPRTGKPYTNLSVDRNTGMVTDESGAPVRRLVDRRTWWVYDATSWDTVGSAEERNGSLMYRGSNGEWMEYNKRWTDDMDTMNNNNMNNMDSSAASTGKTNDGNTKVKVSDKGDKVKIKKTDKQ